MTKDTPLGNSAAEAGPVPYLDTKEILPKRLYWVAVNSVPRNTSTVHYFSIDNEYHYEAFFADFGPMNLGVIYRYCRLLEEKLNEPSLSGAKIVHCCSHNPHKRPNAAFLICAFQVVVLNKTPEEALKPFKDIYPPFLPFRDATYGICTYHLSIADCLHGLEWAIKLSWFDYKSFDIESYSHYEKVENGDINWVIPDKFLAFSGPLSEARDEEGFVAFTPENYVTIFKKLGIELIIRLNKKQYDRRKFTQNGIEHLDLYFLDGSCPSKDIIRKFIEVADKHSGSIAVHCKAGLGRTGTLIGCYAIKKYGFPAPYWIGWNRICRPGSVLGPQQYFLLEIQTDLLSEREQVARPLPSSPPAWAQCLVQSMSLEERRAAAVGDVGQGERLVKARRQPKTSVAIGGDPDEETYEGQRVKAKVDEDNIGIAARITAKDTDVDIPISLLGHSSDTRQSRAN